MTARYVLMFLRLQFLSVPEIFQPVLLWLNLVGPHQIFPDCVRRETVLHSRKHQFLLRNKQRRVAHLQRACFLLCQEPQVFPDSYAFINKPDT